MLKRRDIRRLLSYDKITGLIETQCTVTLQSKGYMRIQIEDNTYRLSDVVYILVKGSIPEHTKVIQLNNNKLDFRLSNLYLDTTTADRYEIKKVRQRAKDADASLNARRIQFNIG